MDEIGSACIGSCILKISTALILFCFASPWNACVRRGTVGARARAKKTYRGVESGVIPALFKTTCQHGIRPGLLHWSPRSSLSAVGLQPARRTHNTAHWDFTAGLNRDQKTFIKEGNFKQTFGIVFFEFLLLL